MGRVKNRLDVCIKYWALIEGSQHLSHPHLAFLITEIEELRNELVSLGVAGDTKD